MKKYLYDLTSEELIELLENNDDLYEKAVTKYYEEVDFWVNEVMGYLYDGLINYEINAYGGVMIRFKNDMATVDGMQSLHSDMGYIDDEDIRDLIDSLENDIALRNTVDMDSDIYDTMVDVVFAKIKVLEGYFESRIAWEYYSPSNSDMVDLIHNSGVFDEYYTLGDGKVYRDCVGVLQ